MLSYPISARNTRTHLTEPQEHWAEHLHTNTPFELLHFSGEGIFSLFKYETRCRSRRRTRKATVQMRTLLVSHHYHKRYSKSYTFSKTSERHLGCSGSIYLLAGSRDRWELVGEEKLMGFQGIFLPPTLVQLTVLTTFFTTCSSYLFCQCQLINFSHLLSWLPRKTENSKSLHRHRQILTE